MKTNKDRPNINQYKEGEEFLKEICIKLKVDFCLFLGSDRNKFECIKEAYAKENFVPVDSENLRVKIGNTFGRKRIGKMGDFETNVIFVKHASAFFNWKVWHENMIK